MSSSDAKFEMKDIVESLTSLTDVMKKMATQIGDLEQRFQQSSRNISESEKEGTTANQQSSSIEWRDGAEFSPSRPSNASMLSLVTNKDAGTKLERPKFVVKLSKTVEGVKKEFLRDSDFLDYFDEYDHYILSWENLPMNLERRQQYPNKERVALLTLPTKYAQSLCSKLKIAFNASMIQFKTPQQIRETVYWNELSTAEVRIRIGLKFAEEVSDHGALEILQRIKFNSQFGLIDALAFADYQHEFKKELLRIQAGGNLRVNPINLKDLIISALPDKSYQKQLFTKYGPIGSLIVEPADFAIDLIFDEVEHRITSVTKQGLRAIVNKATRERESKNHTYNKPALAQAQQVVQGEFEEMVEDQVNAAMAGDKSCRNAGVGKDGLLKCRFLGGPKAVCTWVHPASDMTHKGKGVSKDTPIPQWLNTGKKAFHVTQDPFFDSFEEGDLDSGGGSAYDLTEE